MPGLLSSTQANSECIYTITQTQALNKCSSPDLFAVHIVKNTIVRHVSTEFQKRSNLVVPYSMFKFLFTS